MKRKHTLEALMADNISSSRVAEAAEVDVLINELKALRNQVKQQEKLIESLKQDALSDPLTGLANRRQFEKELHRSMDAMRRYKRRCALMMVDVNDFKGINDNLGHGAGDKILQHIAHVLRQNTRTTDIVARIGGDEFCIILNELPYGTNVNERATHLSRVIEGNPCVISGKYIQISVSIGVYMMDESDDAQSVLEQADENMYAQKAGRSL